MADTYELQAKETLAKLEEISANIKACVDMARDGATAKSDWKEKESGTETDQKKRRTRQKQMLGSGTEGKRQGQGTSQQYGYARQGQVRLSIDETQQKRFSNVIH
jgi:hypothetical protein